MKAHQHLSTAFVVAGLLPLCWPPPSIAGECLEATGFTVYHDAASFLEDAGELHVINFDNLEPGSYPSLNFPGAGAALTDSDNDLVVYHAPMSGAPASSPPNVLTTSNNTDDELELTIQLDHLVTAFGFYMIDQGLLDSTEHLLLYYENQEVFCTDLAPPVNQAAKFLGVISEAQPFDRIVIDYAQDGDNEGVDDLMFTFNCNPEQNFCPADLNGDCKVDAADLALLLGSWGQCP